MATSIRTLGISFLLLWCGVAFTPPCFAGVEDQHDTKFIVHALKSPIPPETVAQARAFDDQLMSSGQVEGTKVYLVTDQRSQRVNALVRRLLSAMGQKDREWVVRALDTDPQTVNAFVTGGKYIYVFSGLIRESQSDEELAFVLSHELGHSLLKHSLRSQDDVSTTLSNLADLIAALAAKHHRQDVKAVTEAVRADYSRVDEEEADAIAVAIAWRAGLDPLRGADFFTRGARQVHQGRVQAKQALDEMRESLQAAMADCQARIKAIEQVRARGQQVNPAFLQQTQAVCDNAEQQRITYNQIVAQYNQGLQEEQVSEIYRSHPADQRRIAAVAALNDFVHGRRGLESLQKFQQSYRVMVALRQIDSVLLKRPASLEMKAPSGGDQTKPSETKIVEQLRQLKQALDEGLITDAEYRAKRQQILEGF